MQASTKRPKTRPSPPKADPQLGKLLSRTDWGEIQELLRKKSYQRKFQIIEAFTTLVASRGLHRVSHTDIAKECGIARQLVDHHFPDDHALIVLSYKYIYAGFQKLAADGLMAKVGFIPQMEGYIDGVVRWIIEKRAHARFLVQFYAVVQLDPRLSEFLERNVVIGRERITALLVTARADGHFQGLTDGDLVKKASSVQVQIFGFLLSYSWKELNRPAARDELLRSCLALLGISLKRSD